MYGLMCALSVVVTLSQKGRGLDNRPVRTLYVLRSVRLRYFNSTVRWYHQQSRPYNPPGLLLTNATRSSKSRSRLCSRCKYSFTYTLRKVVPTREFHAASTQSYSRILHTCAKTYRRKLNEGGDEK